MSEIVAGPWGGDPNVGGSAIPWNWKPSGPITRVVISGNINTIGSITFKSNNDSATYGPYCSSDQYYSFDIKPGEYLIGISGAYGVWGASYGHTKYFTSLSFETNLGNTYGPWPGVPGRPIEGGVSIFPFSYKAPQNSPITGFHGFCANGSVYSCVNNIGVYVKPSPPFIPSDIVAGPWGGDPNVGGSAIPWNWKPSGPITGIVISGNINTIGSITFKSNNDSATFGPYCSSDQYYSFDIKPGEYLIGLSGAYGFWGASYGHTKYFTSLSFETNLGNTYGPWPGVPGRPIEGGVSIFHFSYKAPQNSPITGFHGFCASGSVYSCVNNIGVYVKPPPPFIPPIFVNEWGCPEGKGWKFQPNGTISQIVIFHSKFIHSLMFKTEEDSEESEKFGGDGGTKSTVDIKAGISLIGIKGTFGKTGCYNLVTSLNFYTSDGGVHGPFGEQFGTEFSFSVDDDSSIVGFHGHAGALVNAIGVYLKQNV